MNDMERSREMLTGETQPKQRTAQDVSSQTSMTIDEAKQAKRELQKRIEAVLMDFSYMTGLTVEYINVESVDDFTGKPERYAVSVEAKL